MQMLKKALILLAVFVGVLIIIGLFLPSSAHVERSISINATPSAVFARINDFREFNKWSPWARVDPNTRYTFDGPSTGVGSRMTWVSENLGVGSGTQEIIVSEPNRRVEIALDFGEWGRGISTYNLQPEADKTIITWGFDTEFGYDLIGRYFGLMMDRVIGADYVKGLIDLKELVERQTQADS